MTEEDWDDWQARILGAATRARAAMASGATLDQVLCDFAAREKFDELDAQAALCQIATRAMDRDCAEFIVQNASKGRSRDYARLTLADLELLGETPAVDGVDNFTRWHRQDAIIERKPYQLYTRAREPGWSKSVAIYRTDVPLEAPSGKNPHWLSGEGLTFESVCADVLRSAAAWPSELCVLRNEPEQFLLHFVRAPSGHARA